LVDDVRATGRIYPSDFSGRLKVKVRIKVKGKVKGKVKIRLKVKAKVFR
jgi:hypothetical protein